MPTLNTYLYELCVVEPLSCRSLVCPVVVQRSTFISGNTGHLYELGARIRPAVGKMNML